MGLFFVVLLSLATTVAVGKRDEVQKAYDKLMARRQGKSPLGWEDSVFASVQTKKPRLLTSSSLARHKKKKQEEEASSTGSVPDTSSVGRKRSANTQPEPAGATLGLWAALTLTGVPPFVIALVVLGGIALAGGLALVLVAFSVEVKRRRQEKQEETKKPADGPPRSLVAGLLCVAAGIIFLGLGMGLACRVPIAL